MLKSLLFIFILFSPLLNEKEKNINTYIKLEKTLETNSYYKEDLKQNQYNITVYKNNNGKIIMIEDFNAALEFKQYEYFYRSYFNDEGEMIAIKKYINFFDESCVSSDYHYSSVWILLKNGEMSNYKTEIFDESGNKHDVADCIQSLDFQDTFESSIQLHKMIYKTKG